MKSCKDEGWHELRNASEGSVGNSRKSFVLTTSSDIFTIFKSFDNKCIENNFQDIFSTIS